MASAVAAVLAHQRSSRKEADIAVLGIDPHDSDVGDSAAPTRLVPPTTLSELLSAMIYRRVGCVSPSITVRVEFTAAQGAYTAISVFFPIPLPKSTL